MVKFPKETPEMAAIRDDLRRTIRIIKDVVEDIESEFLLQNGEPDASIENAREMLTTVEQQISDYCKLELQMEEGK